MRSVLNYAVPSKVEFLREDDAGQSGNDDHTKGIKSSHNNWTHRFYHHALYVILNSR